MPFTIAHPAIILPLRKSKSFSMTALITGSIVPDFEYFLQMREVDNVGHHWYGILFFDFPMALLFCFLFHNLLRNTLLVNIPSTFRNRFYGAYSFDWNNYAKTHKSQIVLSLLLGIVSHLLWDGFTHHDGIFVLLIPSLSANIGFAHKPVYFLLQVLFSIAGLFVVILSIVNMPAKTMSIQNIAPSKLYWPLFSIMLAILLSIRLTIWPQFNTFWGVFMAVMGGICYTWVLNSFIINNYFQKNIK